MLLIHGTDDKIVNISYSRKLKDIYSDCRYEEIEGGGHMFRGRADNKACHILQTYMKTRILREE
ncbi:MAG: hypothetical protein IJI41_12985 [Anaerolineaceae bacterium]|nr:hypothetical protein [Anaerolineaceae bacterium]